MLSGNVCHEWPGLFGPQYINTLRSRQSRRHFADNISKCIFLNENVWILLEISLKFVPKVRINNILALVQIMAWRWPGDKPLSEPMAVSSLTHICGTSLKGGDELTNQCQLHCNTNIEGKDLLKQDNNILIPQSISWLLMSWWHRDPEHQQAWYDLVYPEYFG